MNRIYFIKRCITISLLLLSVSSFAQNSSSYIPIETAHNAVVLKLAANKPPSIIYFGNKLSDTKEYALVAQQYHQGDDYSGILNAAYTPSGTHNLVEPAIVVTHADGNTSLDLHYQKHTVQQIDSNTTLIAVALRDPIYPFEVTLFYKVYYGEDVIEQWAVIRHQEKKDVVLHKFASANLYLKGESFWLRQYHGDWAKEMQPEQSRLTHGIKVLDSKLGTRADLYQPPVFILGLEQPAQENTGKVLYGMVEWSGNFRIDLEVDPLNNLRIIAGANNHASDYYLKPKEDFTTPVFLYTFSANGQGEASRNLHRWARKYGIRDGSGSRMTLLNNWESTLFDFNEKKLAQLIKDTKDLGVDLFLLDDGWFANKYPRNSDNAGLGDWQENKQKLPAGIASLTKEATANGVKFGIWLEPEMVNPKSELYEKHQDWVIKQPARPEHLYRNQLVLDLSNPQVQDFVFNTIDQLLTKNPAIAYIKWDCNAVIYNAYSAHLNHQSHLYFDYVQGLYKVLSRVRSKYPALSMMLCSGGGGRVDYAALRYFMEYWPSDNTDPLERIFIQWEYSFFYPAIASANHVTDWGKQSIKFKTDVAMSGKLGFDVDVSKLGETDKQFCRQAVQVYDSVKRIVWYGDQYRLLNPWSNDVAALMYANADKSQAVVFCYLVGNRYGAGSKAPILLSGLQASKKYQVRELNLYNGARSSIDASKVYSGDFLMQVGINPDINSSRKSVILKVEEVQ